MKSRIKGLFFIVFFLFLTASVLADNHQAFYAMFTIIGAAAVIYGSFIGIFKEWRAAIILVFVSFVTVWLAAVLVLEGYIKTTLFLLPSFFVSVVVAGVVSKVLELNRRVQAIRGEFSSKPLLMQFLVGFFGAIPFVPFTPFWWFNTSGAVSLGPLIVIYFLLYAVIAAWLNRSSRNR